jgi:hypothetical protein
VTSERRKKILAYSKLLGQDNVASNSPGAVNEGHMAQETVCSLTAITLTGRVNLLRTVVALVACWPRASGIVTLVDLGVRITQLDSTFKMIQC